MLKDPEGFALQFDFAKMSCLEGQIKTVKKRRVTFEKSKTIFLYILANMRTFQIYLNFFITKEKIEANSYSNL